jgi:hypothetical protein
MDLLFFPLLFYKPCFPFREKRWSYLSNGASRKGENRSCFGALVRLGKPPWLNNLLLHSIFQERIAIHCETNELPKFWVREKSQSSAEIDLILQKGSLVIPVEIKSGSIGKLKSLHSFMDQSDATLAIRLHQGKPAVDCVKTNSGKMYSLLSLPYFLAAFLARYIETWRSNDGLSWKAIP